MKFPLKLRLFSILSQSGQSLVELLVAMGLLALILPAILTGFIAAIEGKAQKQLRLEASAQLQEMREAVRAVRDTNWNGLAINGTYHAVLTNGQWSLASGPTTEGDFTRQLQVSSVSRDPAGQIVASGGTVDPSTKKVTTTVSWTKPFPRSIASESFLTRHENLVRNETTEAEFNAGTLNGVTVTNTSGGEVILGAGGQGDWCRPNDFIVANLDLPQGGTARDVKAVEGKAFTGTSGSGGSFVEIGISNDETPIASIASTFGGYDTRDVFIDGSYAFVATVDLGKDVVIFDLNTNQEVGFYNGNNPWPFDGMTAQGIHVIGNVGYVTIGPYLHTINLTNKAAPTMRDRVFLWGAGYRLQVVGSYAYVAVDWGVSEMRLVNVSNPSNISLGARADVNGARGQEVFVNETGTRAYLATGSDGSRREFFIINTDYSTTNKNNSNFNLSVVSSYESNGMDPKGVMVVPGNKALLVGSGGEEYQVIDITNENSPTRCGGIQVDSNIYGVSAVLEGDGDAYSYIVTGDAGSEFKIIEGGPGGRYASDGIFESRIFDVQTLGLTQSVFNRFSASVIKPANTDIQFQVAVADAVAGSCATANYSFVGPNADTSQFFTTGAASNPTTFNYQVSFEDDGLAFENPGRCFKYRGYLTTLDSTATPVLESTSFNFSP